MDNKKINIKCTQCGGDDFYRQDGLYFCEECNLQGNLLEMAYDEAHNENFMPSHGIKFKKEKSKLDNLKSRRLTSFEEYNFFLIGLVDEILNIEMIPNFKITCLQLWISYLRQCETAFFETTQNAAPKLFSVYRQADAEILYNKKPKEKKKQKKIKLEPSLKVEGDTEFDANKRRRKQMRKSEKIISQQLSESMKSESLNSSMLANLSIETIISEREDIEADIQFNAVTSKVRQKKRYKELDKPESDQKTLYRNLSISERPQVLSSSTLACIIYCALNICKSSIQCTDLLRFVREGHVSLYKCKQFLPEDIVDEEVPLSFTQHHSFKLFSYETFRSRIAYFTRLIPDLRASFQAPNFFELSRRYVDEMGLPSDIKDFIERLIVLLPPVMAFGAKSQLFPNYEGRAMAYVVFVLKLLFGLDGYREEEMSRSARGINNAAEHIDGFQNIFVYKDWMEFTEYRKVILQKFYYATLFHRDSSNETPYKAFDAMLNSLNPKNKKIETQKVTGHNKKRMQRKMNAWEIMRKLIENYPEGSAMTKLSFAATMTPMKDYFQQILSADANDDFNRDLAEMDFSSHSCEVYLKPRRLVEDLKSNGIDVSVTKSTFPKSFVFANRMNPQSKRRRENFRLDHEMNEEEWKRNLKKRNELASKVDKDEEVRFNLKRRGQVIERRRLWRSLITEKNHQKPKADGKDTLGEQPETLEEAKIFSDSENELDSGGEESVDFDTSEDDEMVDAQANNEKIKFVSPDFNLWHTLIYADEVGPRSQQAELDAMPPSFTWLLNLGASILHQHPISLYHQVLCIENQFMNIVEPLEMTDNIMKWQPKTLRKPAKISPKLIADW